MHSLLTSLPRRRAAAQRFTVSRFGTGLALTCLALASATAAEAADSPHFRGPDRDGVYPATGLLQTWPEGGPPVRFTVEGLGASFASMAVVGDRLYTTGAEGEGESARGKLYAIDANTGERVWTAETGGVHGGRGFPGTRTTPTFADGRLHLLTSLGHAVTFDAATGKELWRIDLLDRFDGENLYFGISESPLVVDGVVVYTPGGKKAALVGLDAGTGEVRWTTPGRDATAAYCNPRLFEHGENRQIVTLLADEMIGVDPANGAVLWAVDYPAAYDIHAASPVFHGDLISVSDGNKQGVRTFRLARDGRSVTEVWSFEGLDAYHGGIVQRGGRLFGTASNKTLYVLDTSTGEELAKVRRAGNGVVVWADGRLIVYTEDGELHLVEPDPDAFGPVSTLEIDFGDGRHWSHPVIVNDTLYLRHGSAIRAYDVSKPSS